MGCFWRLFALASLLLVPPPLVRGQTYLTKLTQTKIVGTKPSIPAKHLCHCKVMCAVRLDCLAATFDDSDSTCHISTGPQTSITTADLTSGTSWFKFAYDPMSSVPSTPLLKITLSRGRIGSGTVTDLTAACADDGKVPANLLTREHKDTALALLAALTSQYYGATHTWAWLIATDLDSDGAFEWSDGTPVAGTVFTTADYTGSGSSAQLRSDGKIQLTSTSAWYSYPVVCMSQ